MTSSKRLDSLDALRALACIGIVSYHTYLTMLGYLCVSLFFMLSGFLMVYRYADRLDTSSLSAGKCLGFSLKKIRKLYPLHILTLLIPLAEQMYGLLSGLAQPTPAFFGPIAANILLVQSWIPSERYFFSLNIVSWYLSNCIFLYAMFPLILTAVRRYTKPVHGLEAAVLIYAAGLAAAFAVEKTVGTTQWFLYVFPLYRLMDFAIGCNLAWYFMRSGEKARSAAAATIFELTAIALVVLTELTGMVSWVPRFMRYTGAYIPICVMLIFAFAYGKGAVVRALTNKVTLYIASVSAYVFLIHAVITNLCGIVFASCGISSKWAYILCVVLISFALAEAYRRFENRKKRALTKG